MNISFQMLRVLYRKLESFKDCVCVFVLCCLVFVYCHVLLVFVYCVMCFLCLFVMPCAFFVVKFRPHIPSATSWIFPSPTTTPVLLISLFVILISFSCLLFAFHQLSVSPLVFKFSLSCVPCLIVTLSPVRNSESCPSLYR